MRVIHRRQPGYSGPDQIRFRVNDGWTNSPNEGLARLELFTPPDMDTDGDRMPDVYEFANGLDPKTNDALADLDRDGLTNLEEHDYTTNPGNPDTDNDASRDGEALEASTNPFIRDSDGDGLPDGNDPQPTLITSGVSIIAESEVTLYVVSTSNVNVLALSSHAPVVLLDYWPTNPLPAFVSFGGIQFTNTATNGSAFASLALNSIHNNDVGEHVVALRAAARDGRSGLWNIRVTALDEPTYYVTHWLAPVSGNWNDPTKWSAGVPTATSTAMIDPVGTNAFTVTMNVQPTVAAG